MEPDSVGESFANELSPGTFLEKEGERGFSRASRSS